MKNSDIKSNECDSPKTPGGISKSLLTPIRRLGLSRKWKKSGSSPFVSPLAGNIVKPSDEEGEEKRSRKRKISVDKEPENIQLSPVVDNTVENVNSEVISTPPPGQDSTVNTPIRKVTRKKSKTFLSSSSIAQNRETCIATENPVYMQNPDNLNVCPEVRQIDKTEQEAQQTSNIEKSGNKSPTQVVVEREVNVQPEQTEIANEKKNSDLELIPEKITSENVVITQTKVPNNLTKECIVVIQNKILKPANKNRTKNDVCKKENNSMSQVLFDSDSDDVPLSYMNKKEDIQKNVNLDDDFSDVKSAKTPKVQHSTNKSSLKDRKIRTSEKKKTHKTTKHSKDQNLPEKKIEQIALNPSSQSSNSFDDDDDDFEINKRTILVRKSYDKVVKISKAKSTGSITQRDIDELKARIETKKKLLFAKAMTKETEELRGLIKKWQKGCQDALMELLELMKKKLPDQSNMDYSNILDMLKIPHDLVGYDPENDCFNTPDDNNVLALTFNDL